MSRFCPEAYEALLKNAKSLNHDDLETIQGATEDCLKYVQTVCLGENYLNTVEEAPRDAVAEYDEKRHAAHDIAISSVAVLNRLASMRGIAPVFSGNIADRHQVADFCIELAESLFKDRRQILC